MQVSHNFKLSSKASKIRIVVMFTTIDVQQNNSKQFVLRDL